RLSAAFVALPDISADRYSSRIWADGPGSMVRDASRTVAQAGVHRPAHLATGHVLRPGDGHGPRLGPPDDPAGPVHRGPVHLPEAVREPVRLGERQHLHLAHGQ